MAGKIQPVLYNVDQTDNTDVKERQQAQRNILGDLESHAGEYLKVNGDGSGLDFGEGGGGSGARIVALGEGGTLEQYNLIKSYIDNDENVILYSTTGNNRVYWTYSGNIGGSLLFYSYQGTKLGRLSYYTRSTASGASHGYYQITYENAVKAYNSTSASGTEILEAYADGQGQIPVVYENTYGTGRMIYTFSGITGNTEPIFSRVDETNKQLVILTYKTTGLTKTTISLSQEVIITINATSLDTENTSYTTIQGIIDAGFSPVVEIGGGYSGKSGANFYHLKHRSFTASVTPPTFSFSFTATELIDNYAGDYGGYAEKSIVVSNLECKGDVRDGGTWTKSEHRVIMVLNGSKMGVTGKLPDYTEMKALIADGTEVIIKKNKGMARFIYRVCNDADAGIIFATATTAVGSDTPRLYRLKLGSDNVWSELPVLDIGGGIGDAGSSDTPVFITGGAATPCWFSISKTLGQDANTIYLI